MPGLADYEIPTEDVPLPRAKLSEDMRAKLDADEVTAAEAEASRKRYLTVRGLALQDFTYLVQNHLADIVKATGTYIEKRKAGQLNANIMGELVMVIATDFPTLVTEIISIAADEVEAKDKVAKLPMLVQVAALLAVLRCSTEEAGGLKNLIAFVAPMLGGVLNPERMAPGTLAHKLVASILGSGETPISSGVTDTPA